MRLVVGHQRDRKGSSEPILTDRGGFARDFNIIEWFKLIGISGDKWLLRQIESFGSRLVDLSLVSPSFSRVLDI